MTTNHLNSAELRQVYQGLNSGNYGDDPSTTPPDRNDSWYHRAIDRQLNAFNPQQYNDATIDIDGAVVPDSTQAQFISLARNAVNGKIPTDTTEILYLHTLLAVNGHNGVEGFAFDGTLNDVEIDSLRTVVAGYDAGNTTSTNLQAAQTAQQAIETAAAEKAAAEFNTEQTSLTEQFGLKAAGFDGTRAEMIQDFTYIHQGSLQRFSKEIFGEEMNLGEIKVAMLSDPAVSNQALAHVIQSGDFTNRIVDGLGSNDQTQIQQAQATLKLSEMEVGENGFAPSATSPLVSGQINIETIESAQGYVIDEQSALGDAHIAYTGVIAHSVIRNDIINGNIEVEWDHLPAELRSDLEGLSDRVIANEVASHLSDPANFADYNMKLQNAEVSADLLAKLDNIEVTESTVTQPPKAPEVQSTSPELFGYEGDIEEKLQDRATYVQRDPAVVVDQVSKIAAVGTLTPDSVARYSAATETAVADTETLLAEQIALEEKFTPEIEAQFDLYYGTINEGFVTNENSPQAVIDLKQLHTDMIEAEAAQTSYLMSPQSFNADIGVVNAIGGVNGVSEQLMDNLVVHSQNSYMSYIVEMSPDDHAAAQRHLTDPTLPLEKSAPATNDINPTQNFSDAVMGKLKGMGTASYDVASADPQNNAAYTP